MGTLSEEDKEPNGVVVSGGVPSHKLSSFFVI